MDSPGPSLLNYFIFTELFYDTSIMILNARGLNDSRSIYLEDNQAKLVNGMNLQPLVDQSLMQIYYRGSIMKP